MAWELAIVTLGVLIALAAQQWAEERGWASKIDTGKERLRAELLTDGAYMAEQIMVAPCIDAQINRLVARLTSSKDINDPAPLVHLSWGDVTIRLPTRPWSMQTWAAIQQDGTSNHLPDQTQAEIGTIFEKIGQLRDLNARSEDRFGSQRLLGYPIALSPDLKADLLRELWTQSQRSRISALTSAQTLMLYRKLAFAPTFDEIEASQQALTPGRSGDVRTVDFCNANHLPLADWRADVDKAR